jgi:ariadne-2
MSLVEQNSEESMEGDSSDYCDDDDDYEDDYYTNNYGEDEGMDPCQEEDPEFFSYSLLSEDETKEMFSTIIAEASKEMQVG